MTYDACVLLCEDIKINQDIFCARLKKMGLTIVVANNGKEGVEQVAARTGNGEAFDLIFMDILMPVMDGLKATAEIKKYNIPTPIIALTSDITPEDRENFLAQGMADCLNKPFSADELNHCLEKYLPHKRV